MHIESSRHLPAGLSGMLRFVTSRDGYRDVRVSLAADMRPDARAAILGHELQHACEVAASDAHDLDGMRRIYQAAGTRTTPAGDTFETPAAILIEKQVRAELRADRSLTTSSRR